MLIDTDRRLGQNNYYESSVQRIPAQALDGDKRVDVLVVGAGYAGLSAAIELAQRGFSVAVLEADLACAGASGRNGGQAIVGYACSQASLRHYLGAQGARAAWDLSIAALELIDERIQEFGIACDRVHGYLQVADSVRKARALREEFDELRDWYGLDADFIGSSDVGRHIDSARYCAAVLDRHSGHLHPLKYGLGLLRAALALGVTVYENTPVRRLRRGPFLQAMTGSGCVTAEFGVLAGNCTLESWSPGVAPELTARVMPVGTYMVATEPMSEDLAMSLLPGNQAVCDNNLVLDYFRRSADHRLLFGGKVSYSTQTPGNLAHSMRRRLIEVFPQLRDQPLSHVWGGFVDISMNRAPDFGRLANNLYYLQGFSGHGLALTGLAGRLVAQALVGQAEKFDLLASIAHRRFPGGTALRMPALVLAMLYHRLRDKM